MAGLGKRELERENSRDAQRFFLGERGEREEQMIGKRWRTWEGGEEEGRRRSRFTFYEVN